MTFLLLTETFDLKSGPLYHHLGRIKQFVFQNEEKKYCLTEDGLKAIAMLQTSEVPTLQEMDVLIKPKIIGIGKVSLAPFIRFFSKNPYHVFIEFFILAAVAGYLGAANDIIIVGNFVLNFEISFLFL